MPKDISYKWFWWSLFGIYFVLGVAGYIYMNRSDSHLKESKPTVRPSAVAIAKKKELKLIEQQRAADPDKVIALRIERKNPVHDYTDNIIMADKEEIARFQLKDGKIRKKEGEIPQGKIKFINEWANTYGYENYYRGKRDGQYLEYYPNDQLKIDALYKKGRLLSMKEYYNNGNLRMEADYADTMFATVDLTMGILEQIGVGKIYRIDGTLRYEWHVIDRSDDNFIKNYNTKEELIEAKFYNAQSELIRHVKNP